MTQYGNRGCSRQAQDRRWTVKRFRLDEMVNRWSLVRSKHGDDYEGASTLPSQTISGEGPHAIWTDMMSTMIQTAKLSASATTPNLGSCSHLRHAILTVESSVMSEIRAWTKQTVSVVNRLQALLAPYHSSVGRFCVLPYCGLYTY